jgi:hypothetical protein
MQSATRTKDASVAKHHLMKAITTKEFASLVIIAITAPLFALALVEGARALYVAGNESFLLALTLCGAVVSGFNGFGRRTTLTATQSRESRRGPQSNVALHS